MMPVFKRVADPDSMSLDHDEIPAFPSEWFAPRKPPLIIPRIPKGTTFGTLRDTAFLGIQNNNLTVEQGMAYIYYLLYVNPAVLTTDWSSFGRDIGKTGCRVTIRNLANVRQNDNMIMVSTTSGATVAKHDKWMSLYICAVYRICGLKHDDQHTKVCKTITAQLRHLGAPVAIDSSDALRYYSSWRYNKEYVKLMAFCDMFWCKNKNSPYVEARMGTFPSRYKDCGALTDLFYVCELIGMNYNDLRPWIWDDRVKKDFDILITSGQEIDQHDSYMPYFMELGLSTKSPYLTTLNTNFHYWAHVVGCTLGQERSRNAHAVGIVNEVILTRLGGLFGYIVLVTTDAVAKLNSDGNRVLDQEIIDLLKKKETEYASGEGAKEGMRPDTLTPQDWRRWFTAHQRDIPKDVCSILEAIWARGAECRPGTIGLALSNFRIRRFRSL